MIREQAERLLTETNLLELLSVYGNVSITGSYRMDMMCWNDLDLYIEDSADLRKNWVQLVNDVIHALRPYRFDGICKADKLFLGCETDITGENWNVDIWVRDREHIKNAEKYCDGIVQKTEQFPELKTSILEIKKKLIELNMYGMDKQAARHYHSDEIYSAVLEGNVRTPEEFLEKYPR